MNRKQRNLRRGGLASVVLQLPLLLNWIATPQASLAQAPSPDDAGKVFLVKGTSAQFDRYTTTPSFNQQRWMRHHFLRMVVFSPYFDSRTAWYANGWVYLDAYAIYTKPSPGSPDIATQHPEWILKDRKNNRLYIPWGCDSGNHSCPQFAADFSNRSYQRWWIETAKETLARGAYKGVWIDDVNMDFRVSDGNGEFRPPTDPNTGVSMTEKNWRHYFSQFMQNVRDQLPNREIVHNSIWYAGGAARDSDPDVSRQIAAADWINIEGGVNDRRLTGGTGLWSLNALLAYIDRLHERGRRVIIDNLAGGNPEDASARLYTVANYFLISNGTDAVGDGQMVVTPENWWRGFSIALGPALDVRTTWKGLLKRDYANGMVLCNLPQSRTVTADLPEPYQTLDGKMTTSITLAAGQGTILIKKANSVTSGNK